MPSIRHRGAASNGSAVRIGSWVVDPGLCRLHDGERSVHLRPQLMDLLMCLARHQAHVVSKDDILDEVWPEHYIADSGLTRCMAQLRVALGDDARHARYIETIIKRGYRLVAPVSGMSGEPAPGPAAGTEAGGLQPGSRADSTPTCGAIGPGGCTVAWFPGRWPRE
jgi:DNA-binding winged helix-turn-helix (wHTH) protein